MPAVLKPSRTIVLIYGGFCETLSDTSVFHESQCFLETNAYTFFKRNGKYYLQKYSEHERMDRNPGVHGHYFEPFALNSFPPLDLTGRQIESLAKEKVEPFVMEDADAAGHLKKTNAKAYHICKVVLEYKLDGRKIKKEINTWDIEAAASPGGSKNINFEHNSSLQSVKAYQYMRTVIDKLESEKQLIPKSD